jgi:hypothetical protein
MLELSSSRWNDLMHAYGPATDTPQLLRRIHAGPSQEDWSDLCGSLTHQGGVSQAAYAAVPHVVAACAAASPQDRLDYLAFVACVIIGYDKKPVPPDLRRDYDQSLECARPLAHGMLAENHGYSSTIYVIQAWAALSGRIALARIIEGLADAEFPLECPHCERGLYVWPRPSGFTAHAEDPVHAPHESTWRLAPRKVHEPVGAATTATGSDLAWLASQLGPAHRERIRGELEYLNADCPCPHCSKSFHLYEQLVQEANV